MNYAVGDTIGWRFPGSSEVYAVAIAEVHSPKKKGDELRYRVHSNRADCYAFHKDIIQKENTP